mmetsp:Transcript_65495/g.165014  ORF Transcript_65495/g.165014 Transcript_65495/m.165014 type:complete len:333 (+) Transcript_65495:94-1092(+)
MVFPARALLHRLKDNDDKPWMGHLPTCFEDNTHSRVSMLGRVPAICGGITAAALPAGALGSIGSCTCGVGDSDGGGGGGDTSSSGMVGKVWALSRDARGCRKVQQALEEASDEERGALAKELRGRIREASRCPHANHVIQKCIVVMAPKSLQFIIDEITADGKLGGVARHKYGCRIVQRLIEHGTAEQVHDLVELLLAEFVETSKHCYGQFVVQKLLQHTEAHQQTRLVELVERHVSELALHCHGCAVLGAALEYGDLADRCRLAEMIFECSSQVAFMVDSRHGHAIITRLLHVLDGPGCQRLLSLLETNPKLEEVLRHRSDEAACGWCVRT